jgi:hypothetical protein
LAFVSRLAPCLIATLAFAWPSAAQAHPAVDRAVRLYEEAAFQQAVDAFSEAERGDDLSRADVVRLLSVRAQVHFAMESTAAMETDLRRLAAVDPSFEMGPEIAPQVRDAYAQVVASREGGLVLELRAESMPGGVRIVSRIENDPGEGLVRVVRVRARTVDGAWLDGDDRVEIPGAAGETVEYYGEIVGIGGAVLATQGRASAPLRFDGAVNVTGGAGGAADDDDGFPVAVVVVSAGVAVVLAAVVIGVLVASGGESDDTQFGPPTVMR